MASDCPDCGKSMGISPCTNCARVRKIGIFFAKMGNFELRVLDAQADRDSDFEVKKSQNTKKDRRRREISDAEGAVKCLKRHVR